MKKASKGGKCTIFLFHNISPKTNRWGLNVDPVEFEKAVLFLDKYTNLMPLKEALFKLWSGEKIDSTVITFDDGYHDLYHYAFPILQKYNASATIFIPTYYIHNNEPFWWELILWLEQQPELLSKLSNIWKWPLQDTPKDTVDIWCGKMKSLDFQKRESLLNFINYPDNLPKAMNVDDLPTTDKNISLQFHGHSHTILSALSNQELLEEMKFCREFYDEKGMNIFAYPNGQKADFGERDIEMLKMFDFNGALTTIPGHNFIETDYFKLRRNTIMPHNTISQIDKILNN